MACEAASIARQIFFCWLICRWRKSVRGDWDIRHTQCDIRPPSGFSRRQGVSLHPWRSSISPVIVAPVSGFTMRICAICSCSSNPAGKNSGGKLRINMRILSKIESGSPILSTRGCLREPQPTALSKNNQSQTEKAQANQVAPISRLFSIKDTEAHHRQPIL
jgi:hypothetical protein